ncbi:beta-tubulin 1 [Stachybotrys elegans]|uniref:Beta-tubulin 1 n=1 Tax=Stachybotrys elegans TaxID=80388 RepID=A0A8K0WN11_9HYPO|nr:beta-tubulin 1 [Stachybotrys elegans]
MREIIHLQIGGCGNNISAVFWEALCKEHGIGNDGRISNTASDIWSEKLPVYFQEVGFEPIILETVLDNILTSPLGQLVRRENMALGTGSLASSHLPGLGLNAYPMAEHVLDICRKETEACDFLQGFQIAHSLGSSTGAGLTSSVMTDLRDEFPDRMMMTFSVLPSLVLSRSMVEVYNIALAMKSLMSSADALVCMDNSELYDICMRYLGIPTPYHRDLNRLISTAMAGLNSDLRKLTAAMVPIPMLRLLIPGVIPLNQTTSTAMTTLPNMAEQLLSTKGMLVRSQVENEHRSAYSAIFRGSFSIRQVEEEIRNKITPGSVIPNDFYRSFCSASAHDSDLSITTVANSSVIKDRLLLLSEQANSMLRRKAWLHWYESVGIDQEDITDAHLHMQDVISEYQKLEPFRESDDEEEDWEKEEEV